MHASTFSTFLLRFKSLKRWLLGLNLALLGLSILVPWLSMDLDAQMVLGDILSPACNILAALTAFWVARTSYHRGKSGVTAWFLLAVSYLVITAADLTWAVYEILLRVNPFPSVADVFYLAFLVLFVVAVLHFKGKPAVRTEQMRISIHIAIILGAFALGFWNFLFGPMIVYLAGESVLTQVLSFAYPAGDILVLFATITLLYRKPVDQNGGTVALLIISQCMLIIGDAFFSYQSLMDSYTSGGWIDILYTLSTALIIFAGLLQLADLDQDAVISRLSVMANKLQWLRVWTSFLPYAWLFAAYALLNWRYSHLLPMSYNQIAFCVGVLIMLVILRQAVSIRENSQLNQSLQLAMESLRCKSEELESANDRLSVEIREHRKARDLLSYEAMHDALTGLPNRALLIDRLTWAINLTNRNPKSVFALMFLDLDHFKVVNDSLGHTSGDQLLVQVTQRLKDSLRTSDTVARLGGDEFVVLLCEPGSERELRQVAERIQTEIRRPFDLNGQQAFISASIGVVGSLKGYERPEDVLRDADIAMYQAKAMGKARHEFFHVGMRTRAISRHEIEHDLRRALESGEFELEYQPIIALQSGEIAGFEALLRWRHPHRGLIPPLEFIPVAEETGLILPLGRWILNDACQTAASWIRSGVARPGFFISVNISARQFVQAEFAFEVEGALKESGLKPDCLKLEITESIFLRKDEQAARTFRLLAEMGVECELDDFGTGYSALNYLNHFPIRTIKIDRSFIHAMRSAGNSDVVRALLALSRDLKLEAIAEGLETQAQLDGLVAMGCRLGQGFLFYKSMSAARATELLAGEHARGIEVRLKEMAVTG